MLSCFYKSTYDKSMFYKSAFYKSIFYKSMFYKSSPCFYDTPVFPRFVSATSNYFEFWLVYWIVSVFFDWPK